MTVEEVMKEVLADVDFYDDSGGGLTLSGGEPLLQLSFSAALLRSCKENNIHTCVETSGYVSPRQFKDVLSWMDILLFDYKITGAGNHEKYTGVPNKVILENLDLAYCLGVPIILRCPIIPDVNDTKEHFRGIRALDLKYPNLAGIEIMPYHALGNSKRLSIGMEMTFCNLKTVSPESSSQWIEQLMEMGCKKVRVG
jgi:pyruvate formate lyase activating enzyme